MEVQVTVIVRDDPYTGSGEVLFERSENYVDLPTESLDDVHSAALGFPNHADGRTDWFTVRVGRVSSEHGGTVDVVSLAVEFLSSINNVGYDVLLGMLIEYVIERLRNPRDDQD